MYEIVKFQGGFFMQKIKEFEVYLLDLEKSKETITSYTQSVKEFYKMFDEVNKSNTIAFKKYQLEVNKPRTAALRCKGLNAYCDFIGKSECRVKNIRVYNPASVENVITVDEYLYFLNELKNHHIDKVYWEIRFIASTGVRISELLQLKKSCLSDGKQTLFTKGKIRTIYIPNSLIAESQMYFSQVRSDYLFPNRYGDKMTTRGASQEIMKYGRRYGIRDEVLHPHSFRHFFALQFLKKNGDLSLLSSLLGHESLNTTAIYLKQSQEEQKKILNDTVDW